jgi:protein TonB
MFENALLDSAPSRATVLAPFHYRLAGAVATWGAALAGWFLPQFLYLPGPKAGLAAAATLGLAAGLWALMLCYVHADARHSHLRVVWWLAVTLLLNIAGFVLYLVYSAAKTGNWKRATVPGAHILQIGLIGLLVLYPLIQMDALPKVWSTPVVPSPPPRVGPPPGARVVRSAPRPASVKKEFHVPASIPTTIRTIHEAPLPPETVAPTGPWIQGEILREGGGVLSNVLGSMPWGTGSAPPPSHARPKANHSHLVRVGGKVVAAKAIYQPKPVYPPLAIMAHIQGTVQLQAIIGKDGTVQQLSVLSGPTLLVKAALEAVQHWRYQPTLLNGEPVDVLTEIDVNFKLAD